jgi:ribonuclease P protein component
VLRVESVLPPPSAPNNKSIRKGYLRRRADYLKTYKGRFVRKELFVLYARRNDVSGHRFGITAPKTIGPAVIRNRYKRWSKELYRKANLEKVEMAIDINVFVGNKRLKKEDFKNAKFRDFEKQFHEAIQALLRESLN